MDKVSGVIYHVEDDQPPLNRSPLVELLKTVEEDENHRAALADRVVAFDRNIKALSSWLNSFGRDEGLMITLNAEENIDTVGN